MILHVREKYPDIKFKNQDIFNYTLAEFNNHVAKNLKHAKFMNAIQRIQRSWRRYKGKADAWTKLNKMIRACYMIQRNWRTSKWIRVMNQMAR